MFTNLGTAFYVLRLKNFSLIFYSLAMFKYNLSHKILIKSLIQFLKF